MRAELAALAPHRPGWRRIRRGVEIIAEDFGEHDLLTYASAISFQALYAVVPLTMLALGILGLAGLHSVYTDHVAPTLRHDLSHDGFVLADRTARRARGPERVWWTTAGAAVTLWGVGAALRAMMRPLNAIYGVREVRSWRRRLATSLLSGTLVVAFVFGAIATVLGARLVHPAGAAAVGFFVLRWGVTLVLLLLAIAAQIRFVPAERLPVGWVSVGSLFCVVCWIVATLGFAGYVSEVSYGSFYGALATVVLLLVYLHVAAIAFLLGVVVDARLRDEVESTRRRSRRPRRRL